MLFAVAAFSDHGLASVVLAGRVAKAFDVRAHVHLGFDPGFYRLVFALGHRSTHEAEELIPLARVGGFADLGEAHGCAGVRVGRGFPIL